MENLSDALDSKDRLKLDRLDDIIESVDEDEQSLLILSSDTLELNLKLEKYLTTHINNIIKIDTIQDGLFKKILSNLKDYKNKYILINLFSIDDYKPIREEFQFKRDYIPQERLKFIFLLNFAQYESFKTKAYDFFSFNNFFHHFIDNSYTFVNDVDLSELDDMIKEYEKIKDTNISKESRMKYLFDIGEKAYDFSKYKISLEYLDKALLIANKLKDNFMRALIKSKKAETYVDLGDLTEALIDAKESLKVFKKLKHSAGTAFSYSVMGYVYRDLGNFDLGLSNANDGLKISIKENNIAMQSNSLLLIGLLYLEKSDFKLALQYQEEALSMNMEINNNLGIAMCNVNLGLVYQYTKELDLALEYQNKSLNLSKKNNFVKSMAIALGNIGNIYKDKNDLDLALKYQNEALTIFKDIGYMQGISETLNDIANTYKKLENFKEFKKYQKEAIDIAKTLGFNGIIAKIKNNIENIDKEKREK